MGFDRSSKKETFQSIKMKTWIYIREWSTSIFFLIIALSVVYAFFAAVNWTFNPGQWGGFSRFLCVIIYIVVGSLVYSYLFKDLPKKIKRLSELKRFK
jgi:hypothetical protein